ncbi:MAG: DUF3302 domain-containing protein [Rhodospirillales bacterium]|jgi:uncharacterized membrane protein
MVLDIFALVVFGVLITFVIFIVVKLGPLPGDIASKRGHPQADAINVLGWIGVVTLGLAWPIALVWAYTRGGEQQVAYLAERVTAMESELAALRAHGGDA